MKVEVEGVEGCWVEHRKKSNGYRVAFRQRDLIVVRFFVVNGYYRADIDLGIVDADGAHFRDPNYFLDKAILVMKGIVPVFPYAQAVTP